MYSLNENGPNLDDKIPEVIYLRTFITQFRSIFIHIGSVPTRAQLGFHVSDPQVGPGDAAKGAHAEAKGEGSERETNGPRSSMWAWVKKLPPGIGPQDLVHVSTFPGSILGTFFDP